MIKRIIIEKAESVTLRVEIGPVDIEFGVFFACSYLIILNSSNKLL